MRQGIAAGECRQQVRFTPQYAGLEGIYQKYKDRGLVILGFPANNFGGQEPGTNTGNSRPSAPAPTASRSRLYAKSFVKGDDINPLYRFLTDKT